MTLQPAASTDRKPGSAACVLFDLDGTLADTASDLAYALNATLKHFGKAPLPFEHIRPKVSHGGAALIELGFGLPAGAPGFEPRRRFLLEVYHANLCRGTRLFPGMAGVLETLESAGLRWGIVTNKPAWLTDPLLEHMGLHRRSGCNVSGDTLAQRKPHPAPILHACRELAVAPAATLYVGDASRDIDAGRAAGCTTVSALYGYIEAHDNPADWGADYAIDQPEALLGLPPLAALRPDREPHSEIPA